MADWQPSATLPVLQLRARVLAQVREFFRQRQVLEVETPLLWPTTATDLHIDSIRVTDGVDPEVGSLFLQTSPEFAMKKLLAAGSGSIFQLGKAFRRGERSRRHHPEFTLLEWYRVGFDDHRLMDEISELVGSLTGRPAPLRLSYRELFEQHLALDPHSCAFEELLAVARQHVDFQSAGYSRDDLLHLLLAEVIEPAMTSDYFIYDFPVSMAALARIVPDSRGVPVAKRFELFLAGMEIANGYWELTDAAEQRGRFLADLDQRRALGRDPLPVDEQLLAALQAGLPDCAGVALGLDRLLMVMRGAASIDEVLAFTLS